MELVACLLPDGVPLQVEAWHLDPDKHQVMVRVTSTQPLEHCPVCGFPTHRIHSHYTGLQPQVPVNLR